MYHATSIIQTVTVSIVVCWQLAHKRCALRVMLMWPWLRAVSMLVFSINGFQNILHAEIDKKKFKISKYWLSSVFFLKNWWVREPSSRKMMGSVEVIEPMLTRSLQGLLHAWQWDTPAGQNQGLPACLDWFSGCHRTQRCVSRETSDEPTSFMAITVS